jgi:hypothetical protein
MIFLILKDLIFNEINMIKNDSVMTQFVRGLK